MKNEIVTGNGVGFVLKKDIHELYWQQVGSSGRIMGYASVVYRNAPTDTTDYLEVSYVQHLYSDDRLEYTIFLKNDYSTMLKADEYIQRVCPMLKHNRLEPLAMESWVSQKFLDDMWFDHVVSNSLRPSGDEPSWVTVLRYTRKPNSVVVRPL